METTGMMICKMPMPHKGETHFPPPASHLSDWFQQQQQQWLVQTVQATLPTNNQCIAHRGWWIWSLMTISWSKTNCVEGVVVLRGWPFWSLITMRTTKVKLRPGIIVCPECNSWRLGEAVCRKTLAFAKFVLYSPVLVIRGAIPIIPVFYGIVYTISSQNLLGRCNKCHPLRRIWNPHALSSPTQIMVYQTIQNHPKPMSFRLHLNEFQVQFRIMLDATLRFRYFPSTCHSHNNRTCRPCIHALSWMASYALQTQRRRQRCKFRSR